MPVTVTVEDGTGLSNANSYLTVAELRDYFAVVPDAATFIALSDDVLGQYVIWATRTLDQKTLWKGCALTDTQALAWPRQFVYDKYGKAVASDSVPSQVKAITAEFARWMQDNDPSDGSDISNIKQITVDVIDIIFQDQTSQTNWPTIFNQIIDGLGRMQIGAKQSGRVVKA